MEQANNLISIVVHEDKSVKKKLEKTAKRLKKNYETKRQINEKRLVRSKSPWVKALTIVFDVFSAIMVVCSGMIVFSNINCRLQRVNPSFAGYSQFKISSPSMVASGFNVGDNIVVRSVDATSLNVGDKIAFYVYSDSYKQFNINTCKSVTKTNNTKYDVSFSKFFGVQSKEIESAAKAGSRLVFHHIHAIYEDVSTGKRWFQTKGSSNTLVDSWYVEDSMIVGIYDDSTGAVFVSNILSKLSSSKALIGLVIVTIILMGLVIVLEFVKDVELAKLELDIVQEKRKLTDPICVKNEIGYHMSEKTKYKVLAQATDDQKVEYVSLLWRDGSAPNAIKKYCIRKQILLASLGKELEIHRKCDQMFKDGVPDKQIAKFYYTEKQKIEKDYSIKQRKLRKLRNLKSSTDINSTK